MNDYVYLNYASTSNQKPESMQKAVADYISGSRQFNAGRNLAQMDANDIVFDARLQLCDFFEVKNPKQIIFTSGITLSLNMILLGLLDEGDHVITTSLEHNAVMRPLHHLEQEKGVEVSHIPCQSDGSCDPDDMRSLVKANTKLLVMTHASNVIGSKLPVHECFQIAKEHGILTVLDSAQTAGICPIAFESSNIDILAFTGHKSLMGLAGVGGFVIRPDVAKQLRPVIFGGTGSASHSLEQPLHLPDRFESGTANLVGILSLSESTKAIQSMGMDAIREKEESLVAQFLEGIKALPVTSYGSNRVQDMVPTVSITSDSRDCAHLSQTLFEKYKIITRSGLHCAPIAHECIGTFPSGTIRFSFGYYTEPEEIEFALSALKQILK